MAEGSLQDWVGRREQAIDHVTSTPVRALAATLGQDSAAEAGAAIPELRHWLYFLPLAPAGEVGPDGHPKRGGFLPPVALERRMWAGGRLTFHDPLRIGDALTRSSEILKVSEKSGKTGAMVFVTVRHQISTERGLAIDEEQDIVFIAMPEVYAPPAPEPAPAEPAWRETIAVDEVMLFRFSALTFNGHRIHYDLPYATGREKYPGLVIHGPLQAVLLLDAVGRHARDRRPATFSFRAVRPLFHFDNVSLLGREAEDGATELVTANADGHVGMRATVRWAADA